MKNNLLQKFSFIFLRFYIVSLICIATYCAYKGNLLGVIVGCFGALISILYLIVKTIVFNFNKRFEKKRYTNY